MSLSSLLQSNSYELYCESLHALTINGLPFPPITPSPPGAVSTSISKLSNQTITGPTGAFVPITGWHVFNSNDFQSVDFNLTTGVFTAPVIGRYNLLASVQVSGASITSSPSLSIFVNSTEVKEILFMTCANATFQQATINCNLFLNAGDMLTIQINNPNAASFNVIALSASSVPITFLTIHQIA